MNYIYDILVNFNEEMYDFFDWNESDNIEHIRKIPLIRVEAKDFFNIKHNVVKFDNEFLNKIQNKTEVFNNRKVKNMEYAFLLTNGVEVIGQKIENGKNKYMTSLLIDEDTEVIEVCERLDESSIKYDIEKPKKISLFSTRHDKHIIEYIKKEIKLLSKNHDKLKYLYYECFDKKENNINIIIKHFNKCLDMDNEKIYMKIYEFLKLTSLKK